MNISFLFLLLSPFALFYYTAAVINMISILAPDPIGILKLRHFFTPLLQFVRPYTHVLHMTLVIHGLSWSNNFMAKIRTVSLLHQPSYLQSLFPLTLATTDVTK